MAKSRRRARRRGLGELSFHKNTVWDCKGTGAKKVCRVYARNPHKRNEPGSYLYTVHASKHGTRKYRTAAAKATYKARRNAARAAIRAGKNPLFTMRGGKVVLKSSCKRTPRGRISCR